MAPAREEAQAESKILVIGGTGYVGKFIVTASARLGHPTFALVRSLAPEDPAKAQLLEGFKNSGVTLVQGDLYDHESLVKVIKQVDVVISTVGYQQLNDQTRIIDAIKEAGNIKPIETLNSISKSLFTSDVSLASARSPPDPCPCGNYAHSTSQPS